MATLHKDAAGKEMLLVKGAPEVILDHCDRQQTASGEHAPIARDHFMQASDRLAAQGERVLGLAWLENPGVRAGTLSAADLPKNLVLLGLIGLLDPPRQEAIEAVKECHDGGIRVTMITGDHKITAAAIAKMLGIGDGKTAIAGSEIEDMDTATLQESVRDVDVFARASPEHKIRLVDAIQAHKQIVAMTGDGVNDAPALKKADIGVAMGITGTDVSKEAADMVLADDNFATIVAAVEEGRAIFANIRKFLRYLLSSNIGEVLTMFFGVLLADRIGLEAERGAVVLPLLATQILWINLVTDGPPALALGVDPAGEDVMHQPPRPAGEGVLTPQMWRGIAFVGVIMAAGTLFAVDLSLPGGFIDGPGGLRYAQTMAFTTLMLFQIVNVVNARSDHISAFVGLFTNRWLWAALALSVALQVGVVYMPVLQQAFGTVGLSAGDWLRCIAIASSVLWLREIDKLFTRLRH